jgi:hypothetical protein
MAFSFDTEGTEVTETDADATVTVSHTMGSVVNPILFGWLAYQTTTTTVTAAFNGTPMSLAIGQSTNRRVALFYLTGVGAGAANLVFSGSANFGRVVAGSHSWGGAAQTQDLTGKTASGNGSSTTPSINVPTAVGELIIDVLGMAFGAGDVLNPDAGQTLRGFLTGGATTGASSSQNGADGGVMSWTNTVSRGWGLAGASFAPAAEAGGIITPVFGREGIMSANFGGLVVR